MDVISVRLKSLLPPASESILCSDLAPQQAALAFLHSNILKKFVPVGANQKADKAALDLFIESNRSCSTWEPNKESYHYDTMLRARELFRNRFYSKELQAPSWSLHSAISSLRPGPGSSIGTKHTDFVGKVFNSKLSTYDKLLWQHYRAHIPANWKLAEDIRERQFGPCVEVQASKMSYAAKNFDISRVINTEASLEMMYQLGIGASIENCLLDWFNINLSTQPTMNRHLARLGSIYGSHATIDLKSASDLISTRFVEWFLGDAARSLSSLRAKRMELPDGSLLDLHTFSTMGNGFTFPLQTLLFSCIVEAAYVELGICTNNKGMIPAFSVFGDDIICVEHAFNKVNSLLEWCGFTVNVNKSFNTGSFRESCGEDYFKGHNIRSVYLKKTSHETHFYSIFNRLSRWSLRNGVDISDALCYLKGLVVFRPVPFDAADIAGIKMPLCLTGLARTRNGAIRYKELVTINVRRDTRDYETNPLGILIGALGGYLVGTARLTACLPHMKWEDQTPNLEAAGKHENACVGTYGVRSRPDGPPNVRTRRNSTHSWDWIPQKGLTPLDYELLFSTIG